MEGGALSHKTLRRLPVALAAVCLATGAVGLAMTFQERTSLVPFEPIDYSLVVREPTTAGPSLDAPGADLDALTPQTEFVAAIVEEPEAPVVVSEPPPARASAAGVNPGGGLVAVPAVPVEPAEPEEPGAVLDAEPPPVPEAPQAAPPPAAPSPGANKSVLTVGTGATLPSYTRSAPKDVATPPAQTNRQPATPTVSPTQKQATPTATPVTPSSKGKGNSKK